MPQEQTGDQYLFEVWLEVGRHSTPKYLGEVITVYKSNKNKVNKKLLKKSDVYTDT